LDWDLVWCGPEGQPIDPHDDWEEWKTLLAGAGITKDARQHDARMRPERCRGAAR
jgi:hypothetical protein